MMLKCGHCGSTKFIFTTPGDGKSEHHGAICAACGKRLCRQDILCCAPPFSAAKIKLRDNYSDK